MKYLVATLLLLLATSAWAQYALPITEYDYNLPEHNVSPIVMGMGGMNLTSQVDGYALYHNPALLGGSELTNFSTSFRLAKDDDLSIWQAMQISNALRDKQFQYFALTAKQAGFSYHPAASVHINRWNATGDSLLYYDYKLDKLQLSLGAQDTRYTALKAGLSLKYFSGRLVYLREHKAGINLIRDVFIDDKVKGFSSDLGVTYDQGGFTVGAVIYDVFSRLYWENYDSVPVQRRAAFGFEYSSGATKWLGGVQSKVSKDPDTSYHVGLEHNWGWESQGIWEDGYVDQNLGLRLGLFSSDFYGTSNIHYTLGTGYNYNLLRFDVSMTNKGMQLKDANYLFSVGVGFQ